LWLLGRQFNFSPSGVAHPRRALQLSHGCFFFYFLCANYIASTFHRGRSYRTSLLTSLPTSSRVRPAPQSTIQRSRENTHPHTHRRQRPTQQSTPNLFRCLTLTDMFSKTANLRLATPDWCTRRPCSSDSTVQLNAAGHECTYAIHGRDRRGVDVSPSPNKKKTKQTTDADLCRSMGPCGAGTT
jgi:hypothetical protein